MMTSRRLTTKAPGKNAGFFAVAQFLALRIAWLTDWSQPRWDA
jgi:hypothetical protein